MHFRKMHGLGNDFMVVDAIAEPADFGPDRIRRLADRHRGVGFDQLLVLRPGDRPDALGYLIFNADGSPAEQCGNGMRCLARYAFEAGHAHGETVRFAGADGSLQEARIASDDSVTVDMGRPILEPARIPFRAERRAASYPIVVNGLALTIGAVSMGNPHAVLRVDAVAEAPVAELGPALERHERFPRHANVGFLQVVDRARVRLRVWERGTGETLACGTGACAAVVWGRLMDWLDPDVSVELPGGRLDIRWEGPDRSVWMSGPAVTAFEGELSE